MLTDNDIREQLSYAYVHAVASRVGFGCDCPKMDRDSVDATLSARGRLTPESVLLSPKIDVQLKATACPSLQDDSFSFRLKMKNYDDLRVESTHLPRLLVVLTLPEDAGQWLKHTEDALILRRCAYWHNLKGAPASNGKTQTVRISRYNLFSPEALRFLMIRVSQQKEIGHAL